MAMGDYYKSRMYGAEVVIQAWFDGVKMCGIGGNYASKYMWPVSATAQVVKSPGHDEALALVDGAITAVELFGTGTELSYSQKLWQQNWLAKARELLRLREIQENTK